MCLCPDHDLDDFINSWQQNPLAFSHFVGRAIGRIGYRNLPDLFFAIGTSYFEFQRIIDRINFLYDHHDERTGGQKGDLIAQMVKIKLRDDVVCLHDKDDDGVKIMLLRDNLDGRPYFSIRHFVENGEHVEGYLSEFWDQKHRGKPTFSKVAAKSKPQDGVPLYEREYEFWNFREPDEPLEGVIVYPEAQGFLYLWETKRIADLVVLASNGVGFKC